MKLIRILVPIALSLVATWLALVAARVIERREIEREFAPLTGEIDPIPAI